MRVGPRADHVPIPPLQGRRRELEFLCRQSNPTTPKVVVQHPPTLTYSTARNFARPREFAKPLPTAMELMSSADEETPLSLSPAPRASTDNEEEVEVLKKERSPWLDLASGTLNLVNTIIGGGLLALPFAVKSCGVVLGIGLIVAFFFMSVYTGRLIVRCAMPPINGGLSYAALARASFGHRGEILVEVFIILFTLGAIVGYLVILGDVLTPYINLLFAIDRRLVVLFFGLFICFPLSTLRKMSMLRFTSFAGLFFIVYLVILISVSSIVGFDAPDFDSSRIVLVSLDGQFLTVLPVVAFAFSFHANVNEITRVSFFVISKSIVSFFRFRSFGQTLASFKTVRKLQLMIQQ